MKSCKDIQELMSLYIDRQLEQVELAAFEEHIRSCELCKKELSDFQKVIAICSQIPLEELPDDFNVVLHNKLEVAKKDKLWLFGSRSKFNRYIKIASSVAACLVFAVVMYGTWGNMHVADKANSTVSQLGMLQGDREKGFEDTAEKSKYGAMPSEDALMNKQARKQASTPQAMPDQTMMAQESAQAFAPPVAQPQTSPQASPQTIPPQAVQPRSIKPQASPQGKMITSVQPETTPIQKWTITLEVSQETSLEAEKKMDIMISRYAGIIQIEDVKPIVELQDSSAQSAAYATAAKGESQEFKNLLIPKAFYDTFIEEIKNNFKEVDISNTLQTSKENSTNAENDIAYIQVQIIIKNNEY